MIEYYHDTATFISLLLLIYGTYMLILVLYSKPIGFIRILILLILFFGTIFYTEYVADQYKLIEYNKSKDIIKNCQ
jgi:hypothetical protein